MSWLTDHEYHILRMILNSDPDKVNIPNLFLDNSGQWLMYTGAYIYWFYGNYSKSYNLLTTYDTSSGY
ncbi:hypothetical protein A8C56_00070 [Niabella ginsenosidivorans]|uniref:Uncharacterized protein n=1 Tax=Niabella ginsenosidivorans TaxID=1176587 RepID=A0A1A9HYP1_9BACT|nr:hypothetical protein [Niabella ginsenosidivorans]ANH79580.1 hypothetical protein A8C56_00070 [Niabella ginsenosidivorans]